MTKRYAAILQALHRLSVKVSFTLSCNLQVLVEQSLIGWKEFELEVMRDLNDNCMIVCSIENVDPMGVHTGDSITVAPAQTLTDKEYQRLRDAALAIIREMGVECGGSNVQMCINPVDGELHQWLHGVHRTTKLYVEHHEARS